MGFVGQLYACDWFPIENYLALQFYVCEACRRSFKGANDDIPIHMEKLKSSARLNSGKSGIRCRVQPKRYISYVAVEDSMSQWTLNRKGLAESELPDKHLRNDKIGGLFPYDGYDSPPITKTNQLIAQFFWRGVNGPIYLYRSTRKGIYLFHYR